MRSRSFASRSAVSIRARTCPACTVSPSRTVIWRTSPETFALTVAWRTGCTAPETGSHRARARDSTRARSAGANSRVTTAGPLGPSSFLTRRIATLPPMAPITSIATIPTITRRRVNRFAMLTPQGDRRSGDPRPLTGRTGLAGRPDATRSSLWDSFVPLGTYFVPLGTRSSLWDPCSSRLDARKRPFGFERRKSRGHRSGGKARCDGTRPGATGCGVRRSVAARAAGIGNASPRPYGATSRVGIDMRDGPPRANNCLLPVWPTPFQWRK